MEIDKAYKDMSLSGRRKYKKYLKSLRYSLFKFEDNPSYSPKKEKKALNTIAKKPKNIIERTYVVQGKDNSSITVYTYDTVKREKESTSLVFFIHGGGWGSINWKFYHRYAEHLAESLSAMIVAADYRLSPTFKFPSALEDCYTVLEWIERASEFWQIDKDRIYLFGESSGANLASVISLLTRERKGPQLNGQILLTPIADARLQTQSYQTYEETPVITKTNISSFIHSYIREEKDILNPLVSPLLSKTNFLLPKTFILSAEYDPLHDDAELYAKALLKDNTPCLYYECPNSFHNFMFSRFSPNYSEIEQMLKAFVQGSPIQEILGE